MQTQQHHHHIFDSYSQEHGNRMLWRQGYLVVIQEPVSCKIRMLLYTSVSSCLMEDELHPHSTALFPQTPDTVTNSKLQRYTYLSTRTKPNDDNKWPTFFSATTVLWAGIWTRSLTVQEMNRIDCEPGDADIGYNEFKLVGQVNGAFACSGFEANF